MSSLSKERSTELLVTLLKRLRHRPTELAGAAVKSRERRSAARHDVDLAVSLSRTGVAPVAALVTNISRSGAAIRIHGLHVPVPPPWPTRLKNGDEIWLSGLLDKPVSCWVVAVNDGMLRVHFLLDEAMRIQMREKLPLLSRP
ncbi:MAG: PilZ domain-containing protein [Acetobacteraceae bacterium]|jgi:hypothetical protein